MINQFPKFLFEFLGEFWQFGPTVQAEMKTNSEKHHDLWLDNVELVDAYDDILNSIVETLTAKDGEKYAGEGLKFPNAEPPSCVISSRKRRLLPIYCLPDDKLKVRKV